MRYYGNIEFPIWALKYVYPEYQNEELAQQRAVFDYSGPSAAVLFSATTVVIEDDQAVFGKIAIQAELERVRIGYDYHRSESELGRVRFDSRGRHEYLLAVGDQHIDPVVVPIRALAEEPWRALMRTQGRRVCEPAYV